MAYPFSEKLDMNQEAYCLKVLAVAGGQSVAKTLSSLVLSSARRYAARHPEEMVAALDRVGSPRHGGDSPFKVRKRIKPMKEAHDK